MIDRQKNYERKVFVAELMAKSLRAFDGPSQIEAVEFRREQYGLNSSEMAQVLGIARSHYSEFVLGKRQLPITAIIRAFAIGVPAESLFQVIKDE
jgi:antitoxin component HigA of HigAB toxin-antitoxin module